MPHRIDYVECVEQGTGARVRAALVAVVLVPSAKAGGVILPAHAFSVEQVAQRLIRAGELVAAREGALVLEVFSINGKQRRDRLARSVAAPRHQRRIVDDAARGINRRRAANEVLVRGKAAAALSLKHRVGQNVLLGDVPILGDVAFAHVLIDQGAGGLPLTAADAARNQVKAVHLAAVVSGPKRAMAVRDIGRHQQRVGLEVDPLIDVTVALLYLHLSPRRTVGAGERGKQIVEAAILLHHDDDVLNRRAASFARGRAYLRG